MGFKPRTEPELGTGDSTSTPPPPVWLCSTCGYGQEQLRCGPAIGISKPQTWCQPKVQESNGTDIIRVVTVPYDIDSKAITRKSGLGV